MAHILTHERFRRWRRLMLFGAFLFAGIANPSPDPLSMLLLAVPCVVLVEVAEVVIYFNDRRRARIPTRTPGWPTTRPRRWRWTTTRGPPPATAARTSPRQAATWTGRPPVHVVS